MRTIIKYLAIIATVATLMGCGKTREHGKEADKCNNAALELYCRYADDDHLTVAYLGDFNLKGKPIDAVMLQANDDADWQRIRQDFGMVIEADSCGEAIDFPMCPDTAKIVSVGVGIETDFITILGLDSLTTREQITDRQVKLFAENVAMQLRDILSNFEASDTVMPAAIITGNGPIEYEGENINYDDYIQTVADAIAANIIDDYFAQRDSIENGYDEEAYQKAVEEGSNMMTNAKQHGHSGYITATDHINHTLWLFFYDDQEECNIILAHIKDDIIVKQ